jgi:hypothetical protein
MTLSHTAAVSKVVCSKSNWMIEVGRCCKGAKEIHLIEVAPDVGGTAFLRRLAANESLDIIETADGITLRRS